MNDEQFEALLLKMTNDAFECGHWTGDDEGDPIYSELFRQYQESRQAVINAWKEKGK